MLFRSVSQSRYGVLSNILDSASANVSSISDGKFSVTYTFKTDLSSLCSGISYDEGLNSFRLTGSYRDWETFCFYF